ncbi:MAG: transporter substrate-binding domain-containing protein [Magnetococcus sp. WYHC-3]
MSDGAMCRFVMILRSMVLVWLAVLVPALPASAKGHLVLSTSTLEPYASAQQDGFLDRLYQAWFGRLGVDVDIALYHDASARAFEMANAGKDDGLAMRIEGMERTYPNLLRIPESIIDNDFIACSLSAEPVVRQWQDLTGHSVGHILGWKVFEQNLPTDVERVTVREAQQLFQLLERGRVELVLFERWQGLWWARHMGLRIHTHTPPLSARPMYAYLHRRHAALVAPAVRALKDMKNDGSYQRIVDQSLTPLLSSP